MNDKKDDPLNDLLKRDDLTDSELLEFLLLCFLGKYNDEGGKEE